MFQYTDKVVCVLCCRLQCTAGPSTQSYLEPKKIPSYFYQAFIFKKILPSLPRGYFCSGFLSKICIPFVFSTSMLHATNVLSSLL